MNNSTSNSKRHLSFVLIVLVVAVTAGCGGMNEAPVNVSGSISIAGKPLNQGSVILTDKKGERAYGAIQADGSFLVPQVMPGTFRVAVSVPKRRRPQGDNVDPARGARPMPVPVPTRYSSVDSSGLEFKIDSDKPDLMIELKR